MVWELLPLGELQKECEARGLSAQTRHPACEEERRRDELLHRLKVDMRVSTACASVAGPKHGGADAEAPSSGKGPGVAKDTGTKPATSSTFSGPASFKPRSRLAPEEGSSVPQTRPQPLQQPIGSGQCEGADG